MPKISVIVPVYNVEKYLRRCIDSILGQTFTDFELILVDDGSPDGCPAICDEYAKKNSRIRVIHQENQGQAAARNQAIAQAVGEWVCFVDSDDMIHPQMVEHLYQAAISSGANLSMCSAVEAATVPQNFCLPVDLHYSVHTVDESYLEDLYKNGEHKYWVVWGKLVRKEIVQLQLFTDGRIYEDNAVVCKWLYEAKTVASIDSRLYFYYINNSGTTKGEFSLKQLDRLWTLKAQIEFYQMENMTEMQSILSTRFVVSSASMVREIRAHNKSLRAGIATRRELLEFFCQNRRQIHLSKNQRLYILDCLHPQLMWFYWIIDNKILSHIRLRKGRSNDT